MGKLSDRKPGGRAREHGRETPARVASAVRKAPDSVFLVHGHDAIGLREVNTLLTGLSVRADVLTEIPGPDQSLWQKFLRSSHDTRFAIVILSADDLGVSRRQYEAGKRDARALRFRARQNVILELGFFYGCLGWDNVFVVYRQPREHFPSFERPSDLDGVLFDTIDESGRWRDSLVGRLRNAGFLSRPIIVVDQDGKGHRSIKAAVRAARPQTRILVCQGVYRESLVIEKPLEIVGLGSREAVVIESASHDVISFQAERGRIANLTIRYTGDSRSALNISHGRVEVEDCDITGRGLSCVSIGQTAEPLVRGNHIHHGHQEGIHVRDNARGVIEANTIACNRFAGIAIWGNAAPTVRRNEIYECEQGIYIGEDGDESLEIVANTLHHNRHGAIEGPGRRRARGRNTDHANTR